VAFDVTIVGKNIALFKILARYLDTDCILLFAKQEFCLGSIKMFKSTRASFEFIC